MNSKAPYWLGLLLLAAPLVVVAQRPPAGMTQGKLLDYPSCTHTSFAIDGGDPVAGLVSGTPDALLHQHLPEKATRRLRGLLLVQVLIDSTGRACCPRIQNFTTADNEDIRALALDQLVSRTAWQFKQTGPRSQRVAASSITLKVRLEGRDGYAAEYYRPTFAPGSFKGGK